MKRISLAAAPLAVAALLIAGGCTGAAARNAAVNTTGANTTYALVDLGPAPAVAPAVAVAPPAAPLVEAPAPEQLAQAEQAQPVSAPLASSETAERNWAYWRGPHYNGTSYETGLPDEFDPRGGAGSNVLWKRDDVGGRSSPIVLNGRLYTICPAEPGTPREGEKVVCLDANTGDTLWENRFNVWLSDVPAERVGWSSVVGDPATDRVYALGVCGYFQCIDGKTGKTLWDVPLHEFFGLLSTYGGRTNFPVICDDLVIVSGVVIGWGEQARPNYRLIAFDKMTGDVVWMTGTRDLPDDTTYSAPALAVVNGQKILVVGGGDGGVWAFQPRTGKTLWNYGISRRGVNVSPLVANGRVYMGQSEENLVGTAMGAVACIDATKTGNVTEAGRIWHEYEIMIGKSSPVLVDGKLYCVDDGGKLYILDAETGQPAFPRRSLGTVMRASLLYADGKIYVMEANGRWYILEPDDQEGVKILSKGRFNNEECHASPIAVNGKVYIVTTHAVYCLEDPSKAHGYAEPPADEAEAPAADDPKVAHVQVVPAEVLLRPDQQQGLRVRLFNARGQLLREAAPSEVKFEAEGAGSVTADGVFQPQPDAAHQAAYVKATVDGVTGESRIRIVPALPWKFDFEGLSDLPIPWVGARYRHVIREMDGSNVAVKITTIPKGTRSRSWMGQPELHDYTMQAEVRGAGGGVKLPDIGLIAQGYTLDLQGDHQRLQIRTWDAQLEGEGQSRRMAKTIDFPWKPDTWYVMKFQAANEGDKAVLRGKVWPKGEKEPDRWTIEAVDDVPNVTGAPGLYGNATDAEIYLDNITVTANES